MIVSTRFFSTQSNFRIHFCRHPKVVTRNPEFHKSANCRWSRRLIPEHFLVRRGKGAFHPNVSVHAEWDLSSTTPSVSETVALTSSPMDFIHRASCRVPTDSASLVPVHAVAAPRTPPPPSSLCLDFSNQGPRRRFGTYLQEMLHWWRTGGALVACCRVGKKRTEPSGWTRVCCWPQIRTDTDLLKLCFTDIYCIFAPSATMHLCVIPLFSSFLLTLGS